MNNHNKMCKELYEHYKDNAICTKCGAAWADAGHTLCKMCMKKAVDREKRIDPDGSKKRARMQTLRDERRAQGLCVDCGKETNEGLKRCPECLVKSRERILLYRIRKKVKEGKL